MTSGSRPEPQVRYNPLPSLTIPEGPSARLHLIYLRSGAIILSREGYRNWRDIQEAFHDYMTDLGPWTAEEVIEFLRIDFGDDETGWPFTTAAILSFVTSDRRQLESPAR